MSRSIVSVRPLITNIEELASLGTSFLLLWLVILVTAQSSKKVWRDGMLPERLQSSDLRILRSGLGCDMSCSVSLPNT